MSNTKEKRGFRMHPKLLFDVIQRQAGTLGKAVLEGVMNSIDAKATECHIDLSRGHVSIEDNGQGFRNRSEIENWFEVFGQPHEDEEEKVYGNFRMGRGQLFAFGRNHWQSNVFHMDVDIKRDGLDYTLRQNGQVKEGCRVDVDLYDALTRTEEDTIIREIKMYCKYAPIPVYLDEECISTDPATEKWDHETDDAYIRIRQTGGLAVYHLGVYIREYGGYRFGVGGTIVAKKQLKLNFARNDVLVSKCTLWKRIEKHFRSTADNEIRNKPLNENSRSRLAMQMLAGELSTEDIRTKKLITATTGRQYALGDLQNNAKHRFSSKVSVAPKGDMWGDRAMKQGLAFVVADVTLDRFGCSTLEELWDKLAAIRQDTNKWNGDWEWEVCTLDEIFIDRDSSWTPLADKELKPSEKMWVRLLDSMSHSINSQLQMAKSKNWNDWDTPRRLGVGKSPCALAWTDGSTYIYFERDYLDRLDYNLPGLLEAAHTMMHEYCHSTPDSESHTHSQEFYECYHDYQHMAHAAVVCVFANLEKWLATEDRKLNKKLLKERDRYEGIIRQRELFKLAEDAIFEGVTPLDEPVQEEETPFILE